MLIWSDSEFSIRSSVVKTDTIKNSIFWTTFKMDFSVFKAKPKCWRWKIAVSLDAKIFYIVWPIISISSKYFTTLILLWPWKLSSLMSNAEELKNKHTSYPACTCNLFPVVIPERKAKLSFWNANGMNWFRHTLFKYLKYCLKTPHPDALSAVWLPSSTCFQSPLMLEFPVPDPSVLSGELYNF